MTTRIPIVSATVVVTVSAAAVVSVAVALMVVLKQLCQKLQVFFDSGSDSFAHALQVPFSVQFLTSSSCARCVHAYANTGAALIRYDKMKRLNESFALKHLEKDPTLASLETGLFDGQFYQSFASNNTVKSTIIRRTLLMHL